MTGYQRRSKVFDVRTFRIRAAIQKFAVAIRRPRKFFQQEVFLPQDGQANDQMRDKARRLTQAQDRFDYSAPAELFPSRNKKCRTQARYKRFDTAAEAIRFAVEDIAPPAMVGAYLMIDDERFGIEEIHYLYDSAAFPLERAGINRRR